MKSSQSRGFTLIELVVVITILGILAAFAMPKFIALDSQARIATINGLAGSVKSAAALARGLAMATAQPRQRDDGRRDRHLLNNYPGLDRSPASPHAVNSNNGANGDFTFTAGAPDDRGGDVDEVRRADARQLHRHLHARGRRWLRRRLWSRRPAADFAGCRTRDGFPHGVEEMRRSATLPRARRGLGGVTRWSSSWSSSAIAGVLAAFIAPRFWTQQTFSDRGYADELAAALRSTQKAAVITGCPAQLDLRVRLLRRDSAGGIRQRLQSRADATWPTPVLGADGSAIQDTAPSDTTASPTGVFQFDTQGRLSSSPATTITVGTHTITIIAATGLVQVQ